MAANSNISSVLEQILREIRTGNTFRISPPLFTFENTNNETVTYNLIGGSITRETALIPSQKITDNNVVVEYLQFTIHDLDDATFTYPPRVSINIGIRPNVEGANKGIINFQTTVSGRNF